MDAGYRGTFVISADQSEIDGIPAAPVAVLAVGSVWRWRGQALRIDGPAGVLVLDSGAARELRHRAAAQVARLLGAAGLRAAPRTRDADPDGAGAVRFSVTDGRGAYRIGVVTGPEGTHLLVVTGALPPAKTDLFVTAVDRRPEPRAGGAGQGGMICFTPGTLIATPDGPRPVEAIRPGDRVETRDDGAREVIWTGARRLSGARLYAMPAFRPVRIRAGALGAGHPEGDLIVSADHRIVISGAHARDLFGTGEVLVAARDLLDRPGIGVEAGLRDVTYVHLMTERHQILRANSVATESFHPAGADLDQLDPHDRESLLGLLPGDGADPFAYGDFARRSLTSPEAALWRYAAT